MGTGVGWHRLMSVAVHSVTRVTSEQVNLVKCSNCTHCFCKTVKMGVCVSVCCSTCVLCAQRTDLSHVWYCSALPRPYSASSAAVFEFSPVISSSLLFIPLFIPSLFCPRPPLILCHPLLNTLAAFNSHQLSWTTQGRTESSTKYSTFSKYKCRKYVVQITYNLPTH